MPYTMNTGGVALALIQLVHHTVQPLHVLPMDTTAALMKPRL